MGFCRKKPHLEQRGHCVYTYTLAAGSLCIYIYTSSGVMLSTVDYVIYPTFEIVAVLMFHFQL